MKNAFRLFIKDLKSYRREYLLYFVLLVLFFIASHFMFADRREIAHLTYFERVLLDAVTYHMFFSPGILLYKFIAEKLSYTDYQMLSLPVGRGKAYLARITVIIFMMLFSTACIVTYIAIWLIINHPPNTNHIVIAAALLQMLCDPFIAFSLVSFAWGVTQATERLKFFYGFATCGVGFLLYRRIAGYNYGLSPWASLEVIAVSTLVIGVVYIIIGTVLYNRYADV